ncbi:hypothetical protein HMPREF1267_02390 [Corynebacterium sp. KPL1824]|uniref:hypothetical protein n=1 Tax=Corynebacterium sp. KPL1824 TaxID=1203561 RepID=UPI0003B8F7D9|nr:hypothetical protein [Corynebacterium sp. KPL1824]ERS51269.1 hypothetical protein HMPREF1267_02390 [Corynebacterium sp. KPL1824]
MTDPTRQEILDAYSALEELKNVALSAADFCGDTEKFLMWKNEILKALPPKPQPTMAEIEWDDEKHYLAEATSDQFGRVIMLRKGKEGYIEFIVPGEPECGTLVAYTEYLTPTGRRYTLKEIDND